ncbi:MAG TPA: heparan-alpha-glucosaminide N-acetyltransferase domain-containing protein [Rhizomicrobium sp.]|jgi:predicted acyltransferase
MEFAETGATLEFESVALPLPPALAANSYATVRRERLVSVDVLRGFAVVGMIVVNALATTKNTYGFRPELAFLAHSPWAGFTFADFVFPAFIFIAGFSIAASSRGRTRIDGVLLGRIVTRTLALLVLGFLVTNVAWFGRTDHGDWRLPGVLQRIGLCYFATAILFVACSPRIRLSVALLILLAYWPLSLVPVPGHATNLFVPGANFESFVDRIVLGPHALVAGPSGYDPEGLLSTLPAIAQCLLGTLAGEWLLKNRAVTSAPLQLASAGAVALLLGLAWSPFFPLVKNIWTSSYVLFSTGIALLLLSVSWWVLDRKQIRSWAVTFFEAFGINALLAYILQEMAQLLPAGDEMRALGAASLKSEASVLVTDIPVLAFIVMLWLPLEFMRRRRWILKL